MFDLFIRQGEVHYAAAMSTVLTAIILAMSLLVIRNATLPDGSTGIDVLATVGIESLESLQDVVERIVGERPSEVVPDDVVRGADQVELVDMTPEALRRRVVHGNVVPVDQVDAALDGRFRPDNLAALRELGLLEQVSRRAFNY